MEAQNEVSVEVQAEGRKLHGLPKRTEGEQDFNRTLGLPCLTISLPHGQRATKNGTGQSPPAAGEQAPTGSSDEAMRRSGVEKTLDAPPDPSSAPREDEGLWASLPSAGRFIFGRRG